MSLSFCRSVFFPSLPPLPLPLRLAAQIVSAAQTLALHPSSKIAKENLEVFCEAWESQLCDMAVLLREINDVFEGRRGIKKEKKERKKKSSCFLFTTFRAVQQVHCSAGCCLFQEPSGLCLGGTLSSLM